MWTKASCGPYRTCKNREFNGIKSCTNFQDRAALPKQPHLLILSATCQYREEASRLMDDFTCENIGALDSFQFL